MTTGRDPGELGLYGFHVHDRATRGRRLATSRDVRHPRIWDRAARRGLRSVVVGVPLTYPPPGRMFGVLVSGPLTPGPEAAFTAPRSVQREIHARFGPFVPDVEGFRRPGAAGLVERIRTCTRQRFDIACHLARTEPWDVLMVVDMGIDRFQHAFLRHLVADHPAWRHADPDERGCARACGLLRFVDEQIGRLVELADDETTVVVVSDHGVRPLEGSFAINDWLVRNGYLAPAVETAGGRRLAAGDVDWPRTRAWAEGGYVARIHLNVAGRDPDGVVAPERVDEVLEEIADGLGAVTRPDGAPLSPRCLRPRDVYRAVEGCAPDLIVELDDLALRAAGTVGHAGLFLPGNDTGPDDANHDRHGLYVVAGPWRPPEEPTIADVLPRLA
jgi:predicted AlkP superfamily phosphohydrolase/phosphomutase